MKNKNVGTVESYTLVNRRKLIFSNIKKEKGITLVALVITIIILLILAGISIASLTGNGLFEKAKLAKEKQNNAQIEEEEKLSVYENEIGKYVDGIRDNKENQMNKFIYKLAETTDTKEFNYTGDVQEFIADEEGYYKIECWGAQGGSYNLAIGGKGAYTKGIIRLNKNEKLYVYVGECYDGAKTAMSFNGGGSGSYSTLGKETNTNGGGATDIRLISGNWNNFDSLKSRIMVAAGGGGAYYWNNTGYVKGGNAGGLNSEAGNIFKSGTTDINPATKATQTLGGYGANDNKTGTFTGKFGIGGYGEYSAEWIYYAGGGGGYYGGGSGGSGSAIIGSASGGSSYISGYEGCNSVDSNSTEDNIIHTENIVHYSGKYFLYTRMESGRDYMPSSIDTSNEVIGNSGNGYAKITKMLTE